jgi:hypothetical protein
VNDLIGLQYGWGHSPRDGSGKTDCFQLACEVHERLGFNDYRSQFDWVYQNYTEATFRYRLIIRWLNENGKRLSEPTPGAVALLPANVGLALATVLDDGLLFIAPSKNVVRSPIPKGMGHYFWMER